MFSFAPILVAILLACKFDSATARPKHQLVAADVTPDANQVIIRIQVDILTVTTVQTGETAPNAPNASAQNLPINKRDSLPQGTDGSSPQNTTSSNSGGRVVDLTPADPTGGLCYPGGFQVPAAEDCQVLVNAQLYNSTGSLAAYPGTIVYVSYKTCAAVVQNLDQQGPQVQYNWAMLGKTTKNLFNTCLAGKSSNMGGALFFEKYLDVSFKGLYITLQRFDDSHLPPPQTLDHKPKPVGGK